MQLTPEEAFLASMYHFILLVNNALPLHKVIDVVSDCKVLFLWEAGNLVSFLSPISIYRKSIGLYTYVCICTYRGRYMRQISSGLPHLYIWICFRCLYLSLRIAGILWHTDAHVCSWIARFILWFAVSGVCGCREPKALKSQFPCKHVCAPAESPQHRPMSSCLN